MLDRLNQFFGQDQSRQQEYQDFSQRYQQNPGQISDVEAARRYRELVAQGQIDDNDLDDAHEQAFSQLSPQERQMMAQRFQSATQDSSRPYQGYPRDMDLDQAAQPRNLGRMARQAGQEDPDLLEQLTGQEMGTGAKLALAGAAAFLASKYLGQKR